CARLPIYDGRAMDYW
nr:immunoglobulin heavy chain junction region [Mus musculus]MBK4197701.1 immunoglobulin heavy chain junction region [Mus musculus]MBK4197703.1 immunoglobulin heavy chain junction region [Mus musculus]